MLRRPRADEAGGLYHALNRGNARQTMFAKTRTTQSSKKSCLGKSKRTGILVFATAVETPSDDGLICAQVAALAEAAVKQGFE